MPFLLRYTSNSLEINSPPTSKQRNFKWIPNYHCFELHKSIKNFMFMCQKIYSSVSIVTIHKDKKIWGISKKCMVTWTPYISMYQFQWKYCCYLAMEWACNRATACSCAFVHEVTWVGAPPCFMWNKETQIYNLAMHLVMGPNATTKSWH